MAKYERKIQMDIAKGKELLQTGSESEIRVFIEIVEGKYSMYIPGLKGIEISEAWQVELGNRTWKDSLFKVLEILETGMEFINMGNNGKPIPFESQIPNAINISNENNNSNVNQNTNTVKVDITISQMIETAKEKIANELEGILSDSEITTALGKLDELKEISETTEPTNKKWGKMKTIFNWLTTQGVSIFSTITPIILEILKTKNGL